MFTVKISCANAAFDEWQTECARLLREIATRLDQCDGRNDGRKVQYRIHDINGNLVGSWSHR